MAASGSALSPSSDASRTWSVISFTCQKVGSELAVSLFSRMGFNTSHQHQLSKVLPLINRAREQARQRCLLVTGVMSDDTAAAFVHAEGGAANQCAELTLSLPNEPALRRGLLVLHLFQWLGGGGNVSSASASSGRVPRFDYLLKAEPSTLLCFVVIFSFNFFITASEAVVTPTTDACFGFSPLQNSLVYAGVAAYILALTALVLATPARLESGRARVTPPAATPRAVAAHAECDLATLAHLMSTTCTCTCHFNV